MGLPFLLHSAKIMKSAGAAPTENRREARFSMGRHRDRDREQSDLLYETILDLKDLEECKRFFSDLCSVTELRSMEQRFEVALLLYNGMIYNDILERTGASSATISRVNRSLNYGDDGYQTVLPRVKEKLAEDGQL